MSTSVTPGNSTLQRPSGCRKVNRGPHRDWFPNNRGSLSPSLAMPDRSPRLASSIVPHKTVSFNDGCHRIRHP